MTRYTNHLSAIIFVLCTSVGALAQDQEEQNHDRVDRMQKNLNLTDAQAAEIREIRANGGSQADIHAVLNDEQRATMNEHQSSRKTREQKRRDEQKGKNDSEGPYKELKPE